MQNSWLFRIPGEPVGWRHQHSVVGGKPRARLSKCAKAWTLDAVPLLQIAWGSRAPIEQAVELVVTARFRRPGSLECGHRPLKCRDRPEDKRLCEPAVVAGLSKWHTSTPDATNVKKLAEDALVRAGILADDRWVCSQSATKRYAQRGDEPEVYVSVRLLDEPWREDR